LLLLLQVAAEGYESDLQLLLMAARQGMYMDG
jgi:hypothetical protein